MTAFLSHLNLAPLVYGVFLALTVASILLKLRFGAIFGALIEITVFAIMFKFHGGTELGGLASAVAALLCGNFLPMFLRR